MDIEQLSKLSKTEILEVVTSLSVDEVKFLVERLSEKDDTTRYNAFLLLQKKSRLCPSVYPYWDTFVEKLGESNSYPRSIGLMLLSENARWDDEGKFGQILDKYLKCCSDEKFITSRHAILGLANIVNASSIYDSKIKRALTTFSFTKYKENQQRLLKKDAVSILKLIEKKTVKP